MGKTSHSWPSTQSRNDEQRDLLTVTIMAFVMIAVVFFCALMGLMSVKAPFRVPERTLPVIDIQLLTPEQKQEARETGIACYTYNGIYYVNASLSSDYWEGWIHE